MTVAFRFVPAVAVLVLGACQTPTAPSPVHPAPHAEPAVCPSPLAAGVTVIRPVVTGRDSTELVYLSVFVPGPRPGTGDCSAAGPARRGAPSHRSLSASAR